MEGVKKQGKFFFFSYCCCYSCWGWWGGRKETRRKKNRGKVSKRVARWKVKFEKTVTGMGRELFNWLHFFFFFHLTSRKPKISCLFLCLHIHSIYFSIYSENLFLFFLCCFPFMPSVCVVWHEKQHLLKWNARAIKLKKSFTCKRAYGLL